MKSFIKNLIFRLSSFIYYNVDSKILYLHDVHSQYIYAISDCSMHINDFQNVVNLIQKEKFEIVSKISSPKRQIQICFDDGYRGLWDVKDFFYQNQICPTIFLAYNLIGKPNYLNIEEIRELLTHGFIFQSHTMNHVSLTSLTRSELEKELKDSKEKLSKLLDYQVTEICFPIGYFNDRVISMATKYYETVYSSIPGNYYDKIKGSMIRRNICQNMPLSMIRSSLYGGQMLIGKKLIKQHEREV